MTLPARVFIQKKTMKFEIISSRRILRRFLCPLFPKEAKSRNDVNSFGLPISVASLIVVRASNNLSKDFTK